MKNNLSCEIVQDLLPSYVDGLTHSETNAAVSEHLAECEECKKLYAAMAENDGKRTINIDDKRLFKKVNNRLNFKTMIAVIVAVVIGITAIWMGVQWRGTSVIIKPEDYTVQVRVIEDITFDTQKKTAMYVGYDGECTVRGDEYEELLQYGRVNEVIVLAKKGVSLDDMELVNFKGSTKAAEGFMRNTSKLTPEDEKIKSCFKDFYSDVDAVVDLFVLNSTASNTDNAIVWKAKN